MVYGAKMANRDMAYTYEVASRFRVTAPRKPILAITTSLHHLELYYVFVCPVVASMQNRDARWWLTVPFLLALSHRTKSHAVQLKLML